MLKTGFFERNTGEAWDHFQIQPLTDIHLSSGRSFDIEPQGNFALLWTFMAIALLIVVIASVNFANLATARASQRAREIGMRKALGANRSQLMQQFLGEAIFQALIATVIGLGAAALLLPLMNDFAGKSFEVSELFAARYQLLVWSGAIIVGVAAGLYPAGVLANINSLTTIKGGGNLSAGKVSVRRSLVLFQFVASTFLLLVTIGVYRQVSFMQDQPLGFNKDLTMVVSLEGVDLNEMGEVIRERLGSHNGVMSVTLSGSLPGDEVSDFLYRPEGWLDLEDLPGFDTFFIDESFSETMEIELVSGRALSRDMMSDVNAFLINESAARLLAAGGDGSWVDPLGKQMEFMVPGSEGWYTLKTGEIVGVVSDFHYRSLHETIDPLVLHVFAPAFDKALVKVAATSLPETIDHLRSEVESVNAGRPFEYFFLDSFLDNLYQNERRIGRLLSSFAILVVVIACLGLFGLAAISVQHRRREIGIRKVLGAQWYGLVGLFIKEYAVLVFAASVLAIPLAVFASAKWLSTFAYQAPQSAWVFLWVVLASLIVATISVSYQALRAALSNPVDALRNES